MFTSLAQIISRCIHTVFFLYLYCYSSVDGQPVRFDPSGIDRISSCASDLIVEDSYSIKGIIDATNGTLSNFINIQIKATLDNTFQDLCIASIFNCITPNPLPCYCAVKNGNIYEIVAIQKANNISHSYADIRIQWKNETSGTLKLPKIYDDKAVTTSLTLNDAPITCPAKVTNGSAIKFQCLNSPTPCNITVTTNGSQVVSEHTATYIVSTNQAMDAVFNLEFVYSVCGRPAKTVTCQLTLVEDITTESTTSTLVLTGTLSCKAWGIAFSVIFYINILAIIGTWTAILTCTTLYPEKTKVIIGCIGGLCFSGAFDISLIIAFALGEPCTCDPCPNSDMLPLWKIMMIIFLICVGIFFIATMVVMLRRKHDLKTNPAVPTSEPTPTDPAKPSPIIPISEHKPVSKDNPEYEIVVDSEHILLNSKDQDDTTEEITNEDNKDALSQNSNMQTYSEYL